MYYFVFHKGCRLLPATGALLLSAVFFTGCSGSATSNSISGKITFKDGKPLRGGFLMLNYADQKQPVRTMINPNGSFRANNVPTGKATVTIDNSELEKQDAMMKQFQKKGPPPGVKLPPNVKTPEQMQAELGGAMPAYDPIPAKYRDPKTSDLTWDITSGTNTKDFIIERP
jgi:hypothetical protein